MHSLTRTQPHSQAPPGAARSLGTAGRAGRRARCCSGSVEVGEAVRSSRAAWIRARRAAEHVEHGRGVELGEDARAGAPSPREARDRALADVHRGRQAREGRAAHGRGRAVPCRRLKRAPPPRQQRECFLWGERLACLLSRRSGVSGCACRGAWLGVRLSARVRLARLPQRGRAKVAAPPRRAGGCPAGRRGGRRARALRCRRPLALVWEPEHARHEVCGHAARIEGCRGDLLPRGHRPNRARRRVARREAAGCRRSGRRIPRRRGHDVTGENWLHVAVRGRREVGVDGCVELGDGFPPKAHEVGQEARVGDAHRPRSGEGARETLGGEPVGRKVAHTGADVAKGRLRPLRRDAVELEQVRGSSGAGAQQAGAGQRARVSLEVHEAGDAETVGLQVRRNGEQLQRVGEGLAVRLAQRA
mmetsp:Transcript_12332/g.47548  ORF Transcript_12332/g.47548 Transcript_12332/m.47548 type:complete len:418 (-) Transcript_12332:410-1663(-)